MKAGLLGAELNDHLVGRWGAVWRKQRGEDGDEAGEGNDQQGDKG